jgi:uncharacterized membrane protein
VWHGIVKVDLADGKGASSVRTTGGDNVGTSFDTALSTSTTTISVAPSGGSFSGGTIRVIGYT